jgi:hypothetical protein
MIASARAIPAARRAIAELGPRDLYALARRYRAEYGSGLFDRKELYAWARSLVRWRRVARRAQVGLLFPGRVTLELANGTTEVEQVDLPEGSLTHPEFARALERKLLAALPPGRAHALVSADLAALALSDLVARCGPLESQTVPRT